MDRIKTKYYVNKIVERCLLRELQDPRRNTAEGVLVKSIYEIVVEGVSL